jgi:hypothetical protein
VLFCFAVVCAAVDPGSACLPEDARPWPVMTLTTRNDFVPGVNVMVTIVSDFDQFSVQKLSILIIKSILVLFYT